MKLSRWSQFWLIVLASRVLPVSVAGLVYRAWFA